MVELSHRPLRELVAAFGGCDRYCSEMTSAAGYLAGSPYDRWFLDAAPCPEKTVLQLYAADAGRLIKAATQLVAERTAKGIPVGGIEANFGCSAPHIERTGGGVKWMQDPPGAAALIGGLKTALPDIIISAKLRLGYTDSMTDLLRFCQGLAAAGADYLVLHPRLRAEKFRRTGRWDHVRTLAENLPIPVIGNGDIRGFEDYRAAMQRYQPAGIMLGREAVRRPWIFALIKGRLQDPDFRLAVDIEATGLRMLELIGSLLPDTFHISRARRFFYYYCDNLQFAHHIKHAIQHLTSLEAITQAFKDYFNTVPTDRTRLDR
jgi:tRNA-dihydrouridine synthase